MAEVFLDSKQWGNTLAVRLPAAVARAAHLQADQRVTTAECNADNPFAVAIGLVKGRSKAGKTSYVLCHQPKSFDWRIRGAKAHPLGALPDALFADVCERLNQIIRLA